MKILFVCENYLPHIGGAEVVFKNLAENYVKNGHDVSLVTHQMRGSKKREMMNGVKVNRIPSLFSRYLFTFTSIPRTIKLAKRHDIIQTTTFNGAFPAWLASKITGKPVVITVHEVWVGKWQEVTGFGWLKSNLHNFLERCIYSLPFTKYVCVSKATENSLLKLYMNKNKVQTIHNGFDYAFWNPENFSGKEIRSKLGLNDKFVYFSWGRPGESKGFEYLLRAIPKIKKNVPNAIFLLMLGSREKYVLKYSQLKKLIISLGIENDVKMIDSVGYSELGHYVKSADCVIIPSIAEGFGYAALEAASMEVPVVVSNAGSLPEVISGKHLIFEKKNADDLADKATMIANGHFNTTPVKKFPWDKCVQNYLYAYSEVLD